ncbi:DUF6089 family protein [candidate division KSB1 bacterium]
MKKILFIIVAIFLCQQSFAQRSEVGFMMGTSFYQGDLNTNQFFVAPQVAGGILFRYAIDPRLAIKFSGYYGTLVGDDRNRGGDDYRNLRFKSFILDISPQLEWNLRKYATGSLYNFAPYLFVGVSIFFYNPRTELDGDWYDLQPLGTEGQGTTLYPDRSPYSLTQVAIPFGFGFKLSLSKNASLGIEYGARKTFTDYIDDVSKTYASPSTLEAENTEVSKILADRSDLNYPEGYDRGNENNKDWYTFVGLTLTFKIQSRDGSCPAYRSGTNYRDFFKYH